MRFPVAGLVTVETTVPVEGFPVPYSPVRYTSGIRSAVSGVGWNVALALHTLGSEVRFLGFAGHDPAGLTVRRRIARSGVEAVLQETPETPLSVILYDGAGRRPT